MHPTPSAREALIGNEDLTWITDEVWTRLGRVLESL
jgi:hypothetical protein